MEKERKIIATRNGKDYYKEDLSSKGIQISGHIQALNNELLELSQKFDRSQAALDMFTHLFGVELDKIESEDKEVDTEGL